jgi:hypothetical protein
MGNSIYIRDVPVEVVRKVKARAAENGLTLREYVLAKLAQPQEIVFGENGIPPLPILKEVGGARSSDGTGSEMPVTASKRAERQRTLRARSANPVPHQQDSALKTVTRDTWDS